jgi:chromosome segregation ATPase
MFRGRLSAWRGQIKKCQNKKEKLEKQINQLNKELAFNTKKIEDLQLKIQTLLDQDLKLSEHCMARYRERFNRDATEEEIYTNLVTEELKYYVQVLGNGSYPN